MNKIEMVETCLSGCRFWEKRKMICRVLRQDAWKREWSQYPGLCRIR